MKRALGNADKRGNHQDPDKRITVEVVATRTGVLVAVSDEGQGFDVADIFRRFQRQESYATNNGGGFRDFEEAASLVSYADGGRTVLIRTLYEPETSRLGLAGSEDFMKVALARLSTLRKRGITVETCRVRELEGPRAGRPEIRYELGVRKGEAQLNPRILTGRLLSEPAAGRELAVAKQLYKGALKEGDGLLVPKPMAVFKRHPRLVLYEFDRGVDLREYLQELSDLDDATRVVRVVAVSLRTLHRSGISIDGGGDSRTERARREEAAARIVQALTETQRDLVSRAQRFLEDLEKRGASEEALSEDVPIHGSFGWDCVRRATDRLYLYRFEESRLSHPGFDVGGFLADLPSGPSEPSRRLGHAAREAFLAGYFEGNTPPWLEALPFFTASANVFRLARLVQDPPEVWRDEIDALLDQCEQSLKPEAAP